MSTEETRVTIEDSYHITVITQSCEESFDLAKVPDAQSLYVREVKRRLMSSLDLKVVVDNLYNTADLLYAAQNALEGTPAKGQLSGLQVELAKLCGSSQIAMNMIKSNTSQMLKNLPTVYSLLVKGKTPAALKVLSKGSEYASGMAKAADLLASQVELMIQKATKALLDSEDLYARDKQKKQEMENRLKQMKADRSALEVEVQEMEELVNQVQEDYLAAKAKEERADKRAFTMGIIRTVTGLFDLGIGEAVRSLGKDADAPAAETPEEQERQRSEKEAREKERDEKVKALQEEIRILREKQTDEALTEEEKAGLKKQEEDKQAELKKLNDNSGAWLNAAAKVSGEIGRTAQNAQEQAQAAADKAADAALALQKKKYDLQKEQIALKANLKKMAEQIKAQNDEHVSLDTAVKMLQLALKCLGNIVSALQATAIFWRGIETGCKSLAQDTILTTVDALQDLDAETQEIMYLEDSFMGQMLSYMATWVALYVISEEYGAASAEAGETVRYNVSHPKFDRDAYETAKTLADSILSRME